MNTSMQTFTNRTRTTGKLFEMFLMHTINHGLNRSFATTIGMDQILNVTSMSINLSNVATANIIEDNEDVDVDDSESIALMYQNFNLFTDVATILTALFYGSAFILGTIGNGLIIYIVAHYPRMRTLSNVFLASLAIADLLLVCVCIPIKFVQLITYTWTFGVFMCKAIHYVQSLSAYCSVLTLTIISVERYYAIIHPVQCRATFSMRHIRKMILVTWILSAILASPSIGVYMLERIGHEFKSDHFWCVKIDTEWATGPAMQQKWFEARVIYELYQIITILILPTLVMIFTYTRICTHLWTVFHHRNAMRFGHVCHLMSISSTTTNGSTGTSSSMFSGGNVVGNSTTTAATTTTALFTSSLSSTSTSTTITGNQQNNRNSTVATMDQEQLNAIMAQPPPTPTSIISLQSSHASGSRRQSRQQCCQQCFQHLKTNDEDNQTVKQVIKMLVAVVVLFVLCWAPTLVIGLLRALDMIAETNEGILREIITVTFLLSYLNSVINPIIYGFMSKNFRLYFRLIFQQFWKFFTTGRCNADVQYRHRNNHHHNHHHYYHQNHRNLNNNKKLQTTNNKQSTTMGSNDLPQSAQINLQDPNRSIYFKRKCQSWEFTTPDNYVNINQHHQHPPRSASVKKSIMMGVDHLVVAQGEGVQDDHGECQ